MRGLRVRSARLSRQGGAILILTTREELDALPEGTVVLTGDRLVYQKLLGRWKGPTTIKGVSSKVLLDPEHSSQPVRLMWMPEQGGV